MKVILCEEVDNLGLMGDVVNVAPGYARNYLLPRRLAVHADSASAKQIEHELRIISKREEKKRLELGGSLKNLEALQIELTAKAGEEGKLYGSITTLHIAKKMAELGEPIDRKKIKLSEPIKTLGDHKVAVQLMRGVEGMLKVTVVAEAVEETPVEKVPEAPERDFDDDEVTTMADAES